MKATFKQLFTLRGFWENDKNEMNQEPLMYVFMSHRTIRDYKKVFKYLLELCGSTMSVSEFVSDFEKATWRALQDVFPQCKICGSAFHLIQALFRIQKKLGHLSCKNATLMLLSFLSVSSPLHSPQIIVKNWSWILLFGMVVVPYQKMESNFNSLRDFVSSLILD